MRGKWLWLMGGGLFGLFLWFSPDNRELRWVGGTDLTVVFRASDAVTGERVPGAVIEVDLGDEGKPRWERKFTLTTDESGSAGRMFESCMCGGGARTYAVNVPWFRFRVAADGYTPVEGENQDKEFRQLAHRDGPGHSRVEYRIRLQRILDP